MKEITPEIVKDNVSYINDGITTVIKNLPKRASGSPGEVQAQEWFKEELGKYADDVKLEKFTLHTGAFMGWIYFDILFVYLGIAALWFNLGLVTIVLTLAAIALLVLQLVMYKHVVSPFFPETTSANVFATKKPTGEVKRRIVFCGHTDAAFEWGWLYLGGFPMFAGVVGVAMLVFFGAIAYGIAELAKFGIVPSYEAILADTPFKIALIIFSVFGVGGISLFYNFSNKHTVVDGANDNLSANFTATSVLKTMQEQGIEFENTEVCALMAGSEEAGLRGAYAFSKAHAEEIKNSGIETVFVVLETLKESDKLGVYDKDMCATVATNLEVCDLVQRAAVEVGAIKEGSKYQFVGIGATDAAAFSQYGLKATCLAGLDHKLRDYYHTRKDTVGNTSPECIELAYKTCMRTLEIFDKEGLKK